MEDSVGHTVARKRTASVSTAGRTATYPVALHHSEEGYCVWVPGLPGCVSQGDTEEEALENIADALRDYLEVMFENMAESGVQPREVEVAI